MALNYSNHNITTSGLITSNSGNFITNLAVSGNAVWHSGNFDTSNIVRATGNQTMSGDLTIGGNLTVNGTTITANVDTMTIEDPIITLGLTSGNIVTNDTLDRGLALIRATGLTAFMGWDTSSSQFVMLSSGVDSNSSGNYDAGTYGNLQINNLSSNIINSSRININGTTNSPLIYGGADGDTRFWVTYSGELALGYNIVEPTNAPFYVDSNGAINNGIWSASTIAINKGGTGRTSYSNGQLLIGSGTSLVANTLSAGTGISITNGSGTITINTSGLQTTLTNPITGTGVASHIAYWNSSSGITADSGQLYWDSTNNRLGIGTASPSVELDVQGGNSAINCNYLITNTLLALSDYNTSTNGTLGIGDYTSLYHINWNIDQNGNAAFNGDITCDNILPSDPGVVALNIGGNGSAYISLIDNITIVGEEISIQPGVSLNISSDTNIDGNLTFDSFTESVVSNGNSGTSKTLSLASGTVHTCILTGNCTFIMPTSTAGKSFTMFLNSGSGNYTASFSGVRWADSATPTATILANKVDIYSFISDGSYWYGSFSQNYG